MAIARNGRPVAEPTTVAIGMGPGTFMYVYAGYAAGEVAAGAAGAPKGTGYYALLAVGLLATVAVTIIVTRAARAALRRGAIEAEDHGAGARR